MEGGGHTHDRQEVHSLIASQQRHAAGAQRRSLLVIKGPRAANAGARASAFGGSSRRPLQAKDRLRSRPETVHA